MSTVNSTNEDPSYPPRKKPMSKGKKIGLGILGGIVLLAGCQAISGGEQSTPPSSPDQSTTGEAKPGKAPEKTEPTLGNYAGAKEGDITAEPGGTVSMSNGIEITTSAITSVPGLMDDSYLCTSVTYVNGMDKNASLSDFDFSLQTPQGQILNPTIPLVDGANPLYSTELAPGGTATGDICFEGTNAGSGEHVLTYAPTFSMSTDRAVWVNVL